MIAGSNLVALALMAALNPLVARAPEPRGNIPANCETSNAAPVQRVAAATASRQTADDPSVPLPAARPVSRATTPKTPAASAGEFAELKRAIGANDRAAFDAALARARAAGVATRVYDDIARLWDAQFESPFFAEDSNAYRVASSYPGYAEAVRRQVLTDASGRKFYPAAESRAFVATHVGMRAPSSRRVTTTTRRASATTSRSTPASSTSAPRKPSTKAASRKARTASRKPAASRTKAPPRSPDPAAVPKIAAREPAPAVTAVVDTSSTAAPPAAGSLDTDPLSIPGSAVVQTTAMERTATDSAATVSTATETTPLSTTAPDTMATSDTAPTTSTTTTAAPAAQGRSIVMPAILILIGLGVLILLFRTKP